MKQTVRHDITPLTAEQLRHLQAIFITLSPTQLVWISGYLWGLINSQTFNNNVVKDISNLKTMDVHTTQEITVISASQTGNARRLSEQLRDALINNNLPVKLFNAGEYKFKKIACATLLILIISTYGEGEPPEEAIALYSYLFSQKASRMENTYFAVFSLGDKSYKHFAKAGKDCDERLEELGGHRLYNRVDADLDFQNKANVWIKNIIALCKNRIDTITHAVVTQSDKKENFCQLSNVGYCKEHPLVASLLHRQKITSRSSLKDVHHLEIDISNANLFYTPGDSLGVWYENDSDLINELLELLHLTGDELIQVQKNSMCLKDALKKCYELTQNTSFVVKNITTVFNHPQLIELLKNPEKLHVFVSTTPIVDMIRDLSITLNVKDLLKVLRPIQPRFYSIASAQSEVGEEVHITVNVIRYKINGRFRTGGASGYLVDRLKEDDKMRVFIQSNDNFRLPEDPNVSIIMIGAGTGIAPFRAFMQQRTISGASGKNWLFFGNLKFIDDFLYQIEWQRYVKDGILSKINTAWSRDQNYKIYVQDKLMQNSLEVWSWIEEGAYVYVCGDAKYMARDVETCLISLVSQHGHMTLEKANEFWNEMRVQRRYQRDIY